MDFLWTIYLSELVHLILENILDAHSYMHFALIHCVNRILILNFVHHHFWLRTLQKLLPCDDSY